MDEIGAYVISVTAVALICGIVTRLPGQEGMARKLIQTVAGLVMVLTVIRPIADLEIGDPKNWFENISFDAQEAAAVGESKTNSALAHSIKEQAQEYILDKAAKYGVKLDVEITLSEDLLPVPTTAVLQGDISPYVRSQITKILETDLGIAREEQIWK